VRDRSDALRPLDLVGVVVLWLLVFVIVELVRMQFFLAISPVFRSGIAGGVAFALSLVYLER
jgi:uncharacterized membrane-anchored protein